MTAEQQLQELLFTLNPSTNLPYPADLLQVANGQGTRRWQTVFDTISSQSATDGAPLGYLPSTIFGISNDTSTFSSIVATSYSTLSTQIGEGGIPGSITTLQLQSTVSWIQGPARYVSTGDLVSTITPFLNGDLSYTSTLQSSIVGLGSIGYVSSLSLQSTTTALTHDIAAAQTAAGSLGYVSSLSLQSTTRGLAQAGYVSTATLQSSIVGMLYPFGEPGGSLGVVVTGTVNPPFQNFTNLLSTAYSTSFALTSTNAASFGVVFRQGLVSTTTALVSSLGTYGYVSTATLLSTSRGILDATQNIFIDRSGSLSIYNSQVYISTAGTITFLSSFVNSTLTYQGENGAITGLQTGNSNLSFSSATLALDRFSSLITPTSRITAELYPNFFFDPITEGADASRTFTMTTALQYGSTWLSSVHTTKVMGHSAVAGFSNVYQQPIKMNWEGPQIVDNYDEPYVLYHSLPGALSYNLNVGFRDSNLSIFYGSTNSVFLSIQNLTF